MRRKTSKDILKVMSDFQKFLDKKPSLIKMYQEVQMMKFKVKPIQGDLSNINLKNEKFIETLWSLGKLDEFFQKEYGQITPDKRELFMKVFESIYQRYQNDLNHINLHWERTPSKESFLEVEIFKDRRNKNN